MRKFNLKCKTKNPSSKLQKSLNKYIDKKIEFYIDYSAPGLIQFLENEKKLINRLNDDDIQMDITNGLTHISILCREMRDLIEKEG